MSTNESNKMNLTEVYRTNSQMEADRAIVEVLGAEGIEAYLHDRSSHALPAPASQTGSYFIAVAEEDVAEARQLLRDALEDEALDAEEGEVIE